MENMPFYFGCIREILGCQGFDDGVNTVWDGVEGMHQKIKTLYEEEGKSRKLFITGHSLGGALATIAAARLAFVDNMNIAGMYTIGSPRYCGTLIVRVLAWPLEH